MKRDVLGALRCMAGHLGGDGCPCAPVALVVALSLAGRRAQGPEGPRRGPLGPTMRAYVVGDSIAAAAVG